MRRCAPGLPLAPGARRVGWPTGEASLIDISAPDALAILQRVVASLRRQRVPYAVVGAWALGAWGRPRGTGDLDLLVFVDAARLDPLAARMAGSGLAVDETWMEWNPMLRGQQVRFDADGIAIDLMRPRDDHDRQVLRHRCKRRVGRNYYWFVSPADFILQKLKLGRPRDFEDALTVWERSRSQLRRTYLHRWARRLGIVAELTYVEQQLTHRSPRR